MLEFFRSFEPKLPIFKGIGSSAKIQPTYFTCFPIIFAFPGGSGNFQASYLTPVVEPFMVVSECRSILLVNVDPRVKTALDIVPLQLPHRRISIREKSSKPLLLLSRQLYKYLNQIPESAIYRPCLIFKMNLAVSLPISHIFFIFQYVHVSSIEDLNFFNLFSVCSTAFFPFFFFGKAF